jgi:4-amino-4-deoxy-L-arabinose transferase-like glycosyltransferase
MIMDAGARWSTRIPCAARACGSLPPMWRRLVDPLIALLLAGGYVALLLATAQNLGYARDEGFYFQAAASYEGWFTRLLAAPKEALEPALIDRHWQANNEHPAFMKSLFALSHHYLFTKWQWFREAGTAYRFPGMLMGGLAVAVTYLWGRRAISRTAGVMAALLFAMMPRVFYHSHLDCFDIPVAAMWLVTTWAYWRSLGAGGLKWALLAGLLYGLLLNTKHNSWLLPPALIAHFVIVRGHGLWRDLRAGRFAAPVALYAMALIGPVVFYALWPWIWHDTGRRLAAYAAFHLGHEYYNMEFLGRTYWKPPMPLGYAPLMTAATVPLVTLVLAAMGVVAGVRARLGKELDRQRYSTEVLWVLCVLASYAPWLSPSTPIFGATKHWLTAYPFLCLFAARGFELTRARLWQLVATGGWRRHAVSAALAAAVLAGPIVITLRSHPWGLSAYTPLVGGAPGAASLGLNRTFWGYTTGSVQEFLNQHAPRGASVFVHDTALQSWEMMVRDGRLRSDLRGVLSIDGSSLAIYHHEPHMSRVEYQIWRAYGTQQPVYVGVHDGVPVVWVYARPGTLQSAQRASPSNSHGSALATRSPTAPP